MTISIGSDAGIAIGQTLEVFRLETSKYLGKIKIVDVRPNEAVGSPVQRMLAPVQVGDHVASKIQVGQ